MRRSVTKFFPILPALLVVILAPHAVGQKVAAGGGTIYFMRGSASSTMNSDGGAKAFLPFGVSGEPSRDLHAGHRWFLQVREITGETHPDSTVRREVFAMRGDGNPAYSLRLTDQADLQLFTAARGFVGWSPADTQISWIAARWVGGVLTNAGIYVATLAFDASGNLAGLSAQPGAPLISCGIVGPQGLRPSIRSHDWSPTGTQIVLHATPSGTNQLFLASVATGQSAMLATSIPAMSPVWSPAGTKIAFEHAVWMGGISTINPGGGGENMIVASNGAQGIHIQDPVWSPTGSHLTYTRAGSVLNDARADIYRATVTGSAKANITADIDTRSTSGTPARAFGWR